jgi:single-stranded-DNA-specific exonuclease
VPTTTKRWLIAQPAPESFLARLPDLHPLAAQALYNRGLTDPVEAAAFLESHLGPDDPFRLHGMHRAVTRLRQAIRAGEPIAVYGDFDADGVTATALLVLALQAMGGTVQHYIPHRVEEGYGLNIRALGELARAGVRVVVTVDCGIRFPKEIAYARQQGMDVIVTDHHIAGEEPLEAVAVVNPHQPGCPYAYKHLAGVGLAYKLAQALLRANHQVPARTDTTLQAEDLLDLVALGTVADLAPLTGENRSLVLRGLQRINTEPRPGVEALIRQAGLRPGRIDEAETAFRLLTAEYPEEAKRLAERLDDLNQERQRITAEVQERAREIAYIQEAGQPLLFIADPRFPAGVVGLVASRLAEEFYRPAVVVELGEETSRGSARSIPEFHITHALDACADLLLQHGGHAAAGGFTVRTENLPRLKARLLALAAEVLEEKELIPTILADAEVPLQEMNWTLWEALQRLRPFGEGNPEPLFVSRNVQVRRHRAVGTDGAHLKLLLFDGRAVWDGIAFRQGDWADHLPDRIDIAYHLQRNEWNGETRLQLNIQDIQPA